MHELSFSSSCWTLGSSSSVSSSKLCGSSRGALKIILHYFYYHYYDPSCLSVSFPSPWLITFFSLVPFNNYVFLFLGRCKCVFLSHISNLLMWNALISFFYLFFSMFKIFARVHLYNTQLIVCFSFKNWNIWLLQLQIVGLIFLEFRGLSAFFC